MSFIDDLEADVAANGVRKLDHVLRSLGPDADDFLTALDLVDPTGGYRYSAERISGLLDKRNISISATSIRNYRRSRREKS